MKKLCLVSPIGAVVVPPSTQPMTKTTFAAFTLLAGLAAGPLRLQATSDFTPDLNSEYTIIECTEGEVLAAGSNDNVLRWGPNGGKEQRWTFVKAGGKKYNIRCLKDDKYLDVQWQTGNVSIYQPNGKVEQTFTLSKLSPSEAKQYVPDMYNDYGDLNVDFVFIGESSRNERVAIGSNGRALRWGPINDKTQVFILRKDNPGADPVRASHDDVPYSKQANANGEYDWVGNDTFTWTLYNPLDGGVLLKYQQTGGQYPSDGCSGGTHELKNDKTGAFFPACLAHDVAGDAPFALAEFPSYQNKGPDPKHGDYLDSIGKELIDYLFLKDLLLITATEWKDDASKRNWGETAAYWWHRSVLDFGSFRGHTNGKSILNKGGVVAVKNAGVFVMGLRVSWTSPNGASKVEEVLNHGGRAAVIPLSEGARDITAECWAVGGGKRIFRKTFKTAGMYAYTVSGGTATPIVEDGLK